MVLSVLVLFVVNVYATLLVFNRQLNKPVEGGLQAVAIWLLPFVGAAIALYIQMKKRGRL